MSTLTVVRKDKQVAMAADALTTFEETKLPPANDAAPEKIVRIGDALVGIVGYTAHFLVLQRAMAELRNPDFSSRAGVFETFHALHPILKEHPLTLEAIARYPIITYDDAFTGRSLINKAFLGRGLRPNVVLTALEFRLLKTFLERPGRVQTRETLLSDVWGIEADITTRTVDTHVKRLREKLGPAGEIIETIRGVSVESPINRLLERELIKITGRADLPGRPIQYGTTEAFFDFVGVRSLDELPASDVLTAREIDDWLKKAKDRGLDGEMLLKDLEATIKASS